MSRCQDGTLISFDKAAKDIGIKMVPIKIDDDLQDENSKLRALISNNFGRRKNDPAKDRKALATYVELKGYGQGRPEKGANLACFSLNEKAKELNMSKRNLQRALRIERNLTDSMKELLDTGGVFLDISLVKKRNFKYGKLTEKY